MDLHRQSLAEGVFIIGRSKESEISIPNSNISRQHIRLEVSASGVVVTDLNSTNGTALNGQRLTPQRPVQWNVNEIIVIGSLTLFLKETAVEPASQYRSSVRQTQGSTRLPGMVPIITCASTIPNTFELGIQPATIGADPHSTLRIRGVGAAPYQCMVRLQNGEVEVTNLDANHPVELNGSPMKVGEVLTWKEGQSLQVSGVHLNLSYGYEAHLDLDDDTVKAESLTGRISGWWRIGFLVVVIGAFALICLAAVLIIGMGKGDCEGLDLGCRFAVLGLTSDETGESTNNGVATPTLRPTTLAEAPPTRAETIAFETKTPNPTPASSIECKDVQNIGDGWLDLPFPYQGIDEVFGGSAEGFRKVSQRSRFGGRINSFFDHQFPVYPPTFGGREPQDLADTLITFNGSESPDGFAQDSESADWYSGHSGIDYSPAEPRQATTPILSAAEGRLILAKIDGDGNHMVWIKHDPDGDNRYQYATLYFHLTPDEIFESMLAMEDAAEIAAGQRIGTMGTTGRSSGVHLHFEVRHDINRDGQFSIFERVDPYGFFPTELFPEDPWAVLTSWSDTRGNEYEHSGIISEYLWKHPLVEVVDATTECVEVTGEQVDLNLYPVLGTAVVNPGFTYIAGRDQQGNILREGSPQRRRITVLPENLAGVDIETVRLEFLDPVLDIWRVVDQTNATFESRDDGSYVYSALLQNTGRYVLVGRENVDRVPPITTILLSGEKDSTEANSFREAVEVTLNAVDKGILTSPIRETQYSLNCGQTWNVYTGPFTITAATPHSCGEEAESSETIALDQNDFLLLAMSEDSENNIEQPPAQVRFKINE